MDLDALSKSIHKHLAPWLFVFVVCAAAGVFFIQQYSELYTRKNELDQQIKAFYDSKSDKEQLLLKREKELYQQEVTVKNDKEKYARKLEELESIKKNFETLSAELKIHAQDLSLERQKQIASDKLRLLMSEFSSMGINLNRPPECNDKEGWKIYNSAKAKFSEAESFANANGLYDGYRGFFNSNSGMVISTCG